MYVCMYVCMHVCRYVCVCVCVYVYIFMCICVCVCVCFDVCPCVCKCFMCEYAHVDIYIYISVCACLRSRWSVLGLAEVFDLVSRVGGGAYGQVYRALDKRTGSMRAVKILPLDLTQEGLRVRLSHCVPCCEVTRPVFPHILTPHSWGDHRTWARRSRSCNSALTQTLCASTMRFGQRRRSGCEDLSSLQKGVVA